MKGVVHVGAHKGEEVPLYLLANRHPIICFEPQELPFYDHPKVELHRLALGCFTMDSELRIPHHLHTTEYLDTQSASLFPLIPANARANGWTPTDVETVPVKVMRFDEWAEAHNFQRGSCSLLAIDVQGSELQVLLGFGDYLDDFEQIIVECSNPPLYEGGYSTPDVARYLGEHGFKVVSDIPRHGDVTFRKVQ